MYTAKPSKEEKIFIRELTKKHGIKGCKMSLRSVEVGRQCHHIDVDVARAFIFDLEKNSFFVSNTEKELVEKGLGDVFLVMKVC